ncbi:MAG: hypothetical protein CMQ49_05850 [Gammaproteobacteria bacterium]|nr:hypothetical protein [Gammaproteobacteria bacterium]|tara:strand:- start:1854 stop:2294 length:441 start_codon:yes stop_codon:yes gene_type:complete
MSDIHVDDFFKDGAKVLSQLYSVFPRKHSVYVEDICGPEEPDDFGVRSQRHLACFATLAWLGEEGYLRFEDVIRQEAIDQAVLTARCFTLLSTPLAPEAAEQSQHLPESVRAEQSSTIHKIRDALRDRSSPALRGVMLDLMTRMRH